MGLWSRQISLGVTSNYQIIKWWHEDLGSETEPDGHSEEHLGDLETRLTNLNATIGLSDYWNVDITSTFGKRWMTWYSDSSSIHHRNEGIKGLVSTTLMARYLLLNENIGAGSRVFLGMGIQIPSKNTFLENPSELSVGLQDHTHFTLSDGNYKAILELQYFKRTKRLFFFGSTFRMDKSLNSSDIGFHSGDIYNVTGFAFLHHEKTLRYFSPYLMVSTTHKTRDLWEGSGPGTGLQENSDGGYLNLGLGINRTFGQFQLNFTANTTVKTWLTPAGDDANQIESDMNSYYAGISIRRVINY